MRLGILAVMATNLSLSAAVLAPCPAGTVSLTVGSTVDLQNMIDTINCTGEGSFHVAWTGSVPLGQTIELTDNKNLTITGSDTLLARVPSDGIDAGNTTGIFSVTVGSTLRLQNLVLEGGFGETGGGVGVSSSALYVDGCCFSYNNATDGGAIYANQSEIHIDGGTVFKQNSALWNGGAIYAEGSEIYVNGNTWFQNNSAKNDAGVMYATKSDMYVNGNTSFASNSAGRHAGVFNLNNCSTYFDGVTTFSRNSAVLDGGTILADEGSEIHVYGHSSFTNNVCGNTGGVFRGENTDIHIGGHTLFTENVAGQSGELTIELRDEPGQRFSAEICVTDAAPHLRTKGAMYAATSGIYISGETHFAYNSAVSYGGAMHTSVYCSINITGYTTFEHNAAGVSGGAFITTESACYIDGNTSFTSNTADSNGGALAARTLSTLFISGTTSFAENTAGWRGGALWLGSTDVRLNGTTSFTKNSAQDGGAMVADESLILIDGNTTFSGGSCESNGGAINIFGSNATIMGIVTFSSNTALNGGAMFSGVCPKVELLGTVNFIENSAVFEGGAISFTDPGEFDIRDVSFVSNEAAFGGAVSVASSRKTTAWFERCRFDGNDASNGGALHLSSSNTDEGESITFIQDSVFRHNVAHETGGAVFNVGSLGINGIVFAENMAEDGGLAIMNEEAPLEMENVTFRDNTMSCLPAEEYSDFNQGSSGGCRLQLVCEGCFDGCEVDDSIATITSDTVPSCREIPVGVSKMPTTTLETFHLLVGYYRVSNDSRDILECYRKESCVGGDNALNYCATGYTGPYCAVCADGYSPGILNSCHACSSEHKGLALGLAVGILALAIAAAAWLVPRLLCKAEGGQHVRCWDTISSCYTFVVKALPLSAIKIVVVVLQIITQFTEIAGAVYPEEYEAFLSNMTAINLDIGFFLSNLCIVKPDFYDRLLLSTVAPLVVLSALCGSYIVRRTRRNAETAEPLLQRNHLAAGLFIAFFVYSSVSFTIFQTFVCEDLDDGNAYLRADYSIMCWTEKHDVYRTYASVMVCIYPVGIPVLFAWWLACNRRELEKPDRQPTLHLLSFRGLWSAYKPSCYYYEVVECSRRVFLTGAAVFILPNTADQIATVLLIAVVFIFVSEAISPFENKHDMWLYRWGNAIILGSMYVALLLKVDLTGEESPIATVATSLLIVANVCMIVTVIVQAVLLTKTLCLSRRVEDVHTARSTFGR